jgi:hypothetical protein
LRIANPRQLAEIGRPDGIGGASNSQFTIHNSQFTIHSGGLCNQWQAAEIVRSDESSKVWLFHNSQFTIHNSQFTIHSGGLCNQWQAAEIVRSDESSKVWLFHNSQFTIADVAVQPWLIFSNSKSRSAFS